MPEQADKRVLAGADQASVSEAKGNSYMVAAKYVQPEDGLPEDLRKVLAACEDDAARNKALTDALIKAVQEVVHSTPCKLTYETWDPWEGRYAKNAFQDLRVFCSGLLVSCCQHEYVVAGRLPEPLSMIMAHMLDALFCAKVQVQFCCIQQPLGGPKAACLLLALTACLAQDEVPLLKQLLNHGANPNARNEATRSVLAMACLNTSSDAVRLLLEAGADADGSISLEDHWIDEHFNAKNTPLIIAAHTDDHEVHPLTVIIPYMSIWAWKSH